MDSVRSEYVDPLEKQQQEDYDIRQQKNQGAPVALIQAPKPLQLDIKYELKHLKFKQDAFEVKIYDAKLKTSQTVSVPLPEQYRRIATQNFGFANCGKDIIMTGGQFSDDKTASIDTYRIDAVDKSIVDIEASLKVARMNHSMVFVEEKGMVFVVGGSDEKGFELESCESMLLKENQWKAFSSLNTAGKNLSLCKFAKENRRAGEKVLYIYAFNFNAIERVNLFSLK